MKHKNLFSVIFTLCLSLVLAFGFAGCFGGDKDDGRDIPVESIALDKTELNIKVGESYTLQVTVTPDNATVKSLNWSSSNPSVATVSGGKVTAVSAGEANITVKSNGKRAECSVTVTDDGEKPVTVPVESVSLNKTELDLETGDTFGLVATVLPENATDKSVSWTSSSACVTVSNGNITAVSVGEATITATAGGKSAVCVVTVRAKDEKPVKVPVAEVTLDEDYIELTVGDTKTLTATVLPANATDKTVAWISDKTSVVTVVNGVVTAKAVGSANITATADGKSVICKVTVNAKVVPATGVTLNADNLELKEGETFTLTATVAPNDTTENDIIWTSSNEGVATVENGVVTALAEGSAVITAKAGSVSAACEVAVIKEEVTIPSDSILTYAHAGEESAAFEWKDTNASGAKVAYKISSEPSYKQLDSKMMLIRQISATTARADILGLKGGEKYDFKITSSDGKISYAREVLISALDRSGFAHQNYTDGVGAYNDDGTLKSNAVVFYVTEENKNNIDGNGNSIAKYLGDMRNVKTPVVIRIVGTVGSATWNEIKYDKGTAAKIDASKIVGKDGKTQLPTDDSKKLTQSALDGVYNDLNLYPAAYNGKKCDPIDGLNSKASYDSGKKEYDSCWNDCQVLNATNLTVEGVGEGAEIFQWGFTFKNCKSIEVRNLRFYDYTEDACSFEASNNSTTVSNNNPDKFAYQHFWVHHNTFDLGKNYWDICAEQDKGDGDGATDFKYISHVTVSYNRYNGTHKTGLVGGGDSANSASFTFHHNFYNGCDQRMPLGRQANIHIYNNYFYKSGLYSISLRASAYAYIENCVFTSKYTSGTATKPIELVKGDNGTPSAKVIDCQMQGEIINGITGENNLYVGNDRTQTVSGDNRYGLNFDTKAGFYTVTNKLETNEVAKKIPALAGVAQRSSNIKIDGGTEEEKPPVVNPDPPVVDPTDGQSVSYSSADLGSDMVINEQISDGDLFTAVWNGKATVKQGCSPAVENGGSKKSFDCALVSEGTGGGITLTAKKDMTLTIYYGASNSDFSTKDQSKGGTLSWTIDGGSAVTSKETSNKSNKVAYKETVTLKEGQEVVFTISANRFVLYGLFAE